MRDGVDGPVKGASKPPAVSREHAAIGRFLVSPKALTCVTCHPINGKSFGVVDPTTRGPDLSLVTEHLRREYFQRLLAGPARISSGH